MLRFINTVLRAYFTYSVVYTATFSVASRFHRSRLRAQTKKCHRIAILIPVYQDDAVVLQSVGYVQYQHYPADCYQVFVVADTLRADTLAQLKTMNAEVVEVTFDERTKARSVAEGLQRIQQHGYYDLTVILDADNVMDKNFLMHINRAYASGQVAVQGQRTAKNSNSPVAILDGLSEAVNNAIFRKGYQALGLSVPVIGSGMAFDTNLLTSVFQQMDLASKGEDRELQLEIIRRRHHIHYLEEAVVYDEKVATDRAFGHQRKRWILNQFHSLLKSFPVAAHQLTKGNVSYFNIAFLAPIQLPRLLNVGFLTGWTLLQWTTKQKATYATTLAAVYFVSLALAIPRSYLRKSTLSALAALPQTFGTMSLSLLTARQASKQFLHTVHSAEHEVNL
jgi:cellulose synthase/poly-beta-1,6-N-acetylglucosamine synthase-like glycosyltransferase